MFHETGLTKLLEFDVAMFVFSVFQLGLTNLIVFKLN